MTGGRDGAASRLHDARKEAALEGMRRRGTMAAAARAADVRLGTLYGWRSSDAEFAEALYYAEQEFVDAAVEELHERAVRGDEQLVYYRGEPVPRRDPETGEVLLDDNFDPIYYTRHVKSDKLLEVLLKSRRAEFRERTELTVSGPGGGPLRVDNAVTVNLVLPDGRTMDDYDGGDVIEAEATEVIGTDGDDS